MVTDSERTLGHDMPACNHLEADYRMVLYVRELLQLGYSEILVRSGDTDVIIIMIGHVQQLLELYPNIALTILFCTPNANKTEYIDVVRIAREIGLNHCRGFMLLYAFTGCDYTPSFSYHGKSGWFDHFIGNEPIKDLLEDMCCNPKNLSNEKLVSLANFTLHLYGVADPSAGLLVGRMEVLKRPKSLTFRFLPPSPGAALVQVKKAVFVASEIWSKANEPVIQYGEMKNWGWKQDNGSWTPIWTVCPCPGDDVFENCIKKCSKKCRCTTCHCKIKFKYNCLPECGCSGKCHIVTTD